MKGTLFPFRKKENRFYSVTEAAAARTVVKKTAFRVSKGMRRLPERSTRSPHTGQYVIPIAGVEKPEKVVNFRCRCEVERGLRAESCLIATAGAMPLIVGDPYLSNVTDVDQVLAVIALHFDQT